LSFARIAPGVYRPDWEVRALRFVGSHRILVLAAVVAALVAIGTVARRGGGGERGRTAACARSQEGDAEQHAAGDRDRESQRGGARKSASEVGGLFAGPGERVDRERCDRPGHPESFADLAKANSSRMTREVAPGTQIKPGAERAALKAANDLPTIGSTWSPYGKTPLIANRTEYDTTLGSTREGFVGLSGRTTSFARDSGGTLYAAASNGGVWKSTDQAASWSPIADDLPTQVVSGIAWSPTHGGTLMVLTGDNAYGGDTYAGLGVYRSTDGGATWQHSAGVPDGLLGFKMAVDPNDADVVYAATGGGLYRSPDGGASFVNVSLPTGQNAPAGTPDCTGKPPTAKDCFLANMVTDVVVQGPANSKTTGTNATPGAVLAAVGWRAGKKHNADGAEQSPGNGIYESETGAPGSFTNLDMAGHSTPTTDPLTAQRIGRIALGVADGPEQDHRYVYAIVMDAVKFNGGVTGEDLDRPGSTTAAVSDYLNGLWVSRDFGRSWRQLEGSTTIDNDSTSNSALAPPVCKAPAVIAYCPGIHAWYNLWVAPDPTQATSTGVPSRLAFGLEEVWANPSPDSNGLDGSAEKKFQVIGRYYGNSACTPLTLTNDLPICPTASGGSPPPTTTHPDQHGWLWIPDGSGGVTLVAGNDGGVYSQHAKSGEAFDNTKWGDGNNNGLHTLQPYDAEMAKDGTVYMGLQDNGEAKIDHDGTSYTIYGGDGFFTAVDPDNSDHAYEEYVGGDMSVTTDGGKTWNDIAPAGLTASLFSTPFQMDPANANHLMIGGRDIEETTDGTATTSGSWTKVFDLGTQKHPGDAGAAAAADDPNNQLSAVDLRSSPQPAGAPTGPPTADFAYTGGASTIPDPVGSVTGDGTDLAPGSYEDHPFTIGPNDGDGSATINISWADSNNDWDLWVYRRDGSGNLTQVGRSANGNTTSEQVVIPNPGLGDYVIRVANFAATGTYDAKATFAPPTAGGGDGPSAAYVGYCGFCDTITQGIPFGNGIATNVNAAPGKANDSAGWHIAKASGLPSRYITSVQMDPTDPRTVYVTLAGYGRRWAFPGAVGEDTSNVGTGHVFKSTDAGETFTDVSGDLPDAPANWSVLHNGHVVVGTDIGVFESCDAAGGAYSRLGTNLPATPISTLRLKPGDPGLLVAATYGRGVYTYRFGDDNGRCPPKAGAPGTGGRQAGVTGNPGAQAGGGGSSGGAPVCAASAGFRSATVRPRGRGLRFDVTRAVPANYTADVYRQATLHRTGHARRVARLGSRAGLFTWPGSRRLVDGFYFAQVRVKVGTATDLRRFPMVLRRGRFHRARQYYRRASCKLLSIARLSGPAFGGRTRTSLLVSFRTLTSGRVTVTVKRGRRTVRRFRVARSGTHTLRRKIRALSVPRGAYTIMISASAGGVRETARLAARRI
jgi:hypothetical protein